MEAANLNTSSPQQDPTAQKESLLDDSETCLSVSPTKKRIKLEAFAAQTSDAEKIVERVTLFVQSKLDGNDGSHDMLHINRVVNLAVSLALKEQIEDILSVQLGAVLHEIGDEKYCSNSEAEVNEAVQFLESLEIGSQTIQKVKSIIEGVSFRKELATKFQSDGNIIPELACVQDADRLDAIGAVGVARCFTFGGARKRALYNTNDKPRNDMTSQEYASSGGNTVNHFYEKLFKLKDLMKTKSGRAIAEERHAFMEAFVNRFWLEVEGVA